MGCSMFDCRLFTRLTWFGSFTKWISVFWHCEFLVSISSEMAIDFDVMLIMIWWLLISTIQKYTKLKCIHRLSFSKRYWKKRVFTLIHLSKVANDRCLICMSQLTFNGWFDLFHDRSPITLVFCRFLQIENRECLMIDWLMDWFETTDNRRDTIYEQETTTNR